MKNLLLLLLSISAMAQSALTGNWTGVLHQKSSDHTPFTEYKFAMKIEESGGIVKGVSTIIVGANFGILEFSGTFSNNKLTFQETKILKQEKATGGFDWCYKGGTVSMKQVGQEFVLEGPWQGYTLYGTMKNPCMPGTFKLVKEQGFISMKGNTVDENNAPIGSEIRIVNVATGKEETRIKTANGEFDIKLPGKNTYELTISSKGYLTSHESVELSESRILNIQLIRIQVGQNVPLKHILFKRASDTLIVDSYPELERLVKFLVENPNVNIELQGHTSNEGNANDNLKLSELRVKKIKSYLTEKGISESRLTVKAFGGTKPLVPNDTEAHRMQNRRVEYMITSK